MKSLVEKLTKKKLKISFAESCTGGMLASSITSISGASKVFDMGLITYSNRAKIKILKVNENIIKNNGAVSAECCKAMVVNLSKISKAGIKKGKKTKIVKNIFKFKSRKSIQKATVNKTYEIINSLI